jgi:hypothetical protein
MGSEVFGGVPGSLDNECRLWFLPDRRRSQVVGFGEYSLEFSLAGSGGSA